MQRPAARDGVVGQSLDHSQLRGVDIFRVNGDESLAASPFHNLRAQALQNLHQQIAPYSRVLVDQDALAVERGAGKEIGESFDVGDTRFAVLCRKGLVTALEHAALIKLRLIPGLLVEPLAYLPHPLVDGRFLLL